MHKAESKEKTPFRVLLEVFPWKAIMAEGVGQIRTYTPLPTWAQYCYLENLTDQKYSISFANQIILEAVISLTKDTEAWGHAQLDGVHTYRTKFFWTLKWFLKVGR